MGNRDVRKYIYNFSRGKVTRKFEILGGKTRYFVLCYEHDKKWLSLTFCLISTTFCSQKNASSLKHKNFADTSIKKLLLEGCIEEVKEIPYCCNPLIIAEGQKLRLVLDLRHVNTCLKFPKFKYEDLKTASQHLENDFYFTTFDLKSGYHHIPIHKDDQKFLDFLGLLKMELHDIFSFLSYHLV